MKRNLLRASTGHSGIDSFLDIITNVIGVLILIAVTIAMQVMNVSVKMSSPLVQDPPNT